MLVAFMDPILAAAGANPVAGSLGYSVAQVVAALDGEVAQRDERLGDGLLGRLLCVSPARLRVLIVMRVVRLALCY